jgi:hypothetical protein
MRAGQKEITARISPLQEGPMGCDEAGVPLLKGDEMLAFQKEMLHVLIHPSIVSGQGTPGNREPWSRPSATIPERAHLYSNQLIAVKVYFPKK